MPSNQTRLDKRLHRWCALLQISMDDWMRRAWPVEMVIYAKKDIYENP